MRNCLISGVPLNKGLYTITIKITFLFRDIWRLRLQTVLKCLLFCLYWKLDICGRHFKNVHKWKLDICGSLKYLICSMSMGIYYVELYQRNFNYIQHWALQKCKQMKIRHLWHLHIVNLWHGCLICGVPSNIINLI